MSEMVERVAETLCEERRRIWNEKYPDKADDFTWDKENEGFREQLRREARAVIAAMREPTKEMIDAAFRAELDIYWSYRADGRPGGPEDVWQTMVAAINTDQETEA